MKKNKIDEHLKSGPTTTIIIGQSGSGKGTIVRMLKNYLQEIDSSHAVVGIEMGDLFRSWIPTLSEWRRKKIEEDQNAGKLQSYRIATYLWTRELNDRLREGDEHLIIDGSPRSPKEASLLIESITEDFGRNPIIISLSISDETAVSRIKERNKLLIEAGKAPRQETMTYEAIKNKLAYYYTDVVPALSSIPEKYFARSYRASEHNEKFDFKEVSINAELPIEQVFQAVLSSIAITIWRRNIPKNYEKKIVEVVI